MSTRPKQVVRRIFHRNGVVAAEENFCGQKLHGRRRTWHRNGELASEEFYRDGLLHGPCSQWDENGKLLGKYKMIHGTGTQQSWHGNGRLNLEFSTVNGGFFGRSRLWLQDGTLLSDQIYLQGRVVTPVEYRKESSRDTRLPKLKGGIGKTLPKNRTTQKLIHRVFVSSLLAKRNRSEARTWLNAGDKTARSLGHFKRSSDAAKFVEEIYQAGAVKVIVPDIYQGKHGDQFADALLVQLPKPPKARKADSQGV